MYGKFQRERIGMKCELVSIAEDQPIEVTKNQDIRQENSGKIGKNRMVEIAWKENDLAEDQPGPSGIQQRKPSEDYDPHMPGPSTIKMAKLEIAKTESEIEKKIKANATKEPVDPIKLFAENVTIAGLEEAYDEKIKPTRIMFRIALLFFSAVIIYETTSIVGQYKSQDTVFLDLELIDKRAPFPNVSICYPPYTISANIIDGVISSLVETWKMKSNFSGDDATKKFLLSIPAVEAFIKHKISGNDLMNLLLGVPSLSRVGALKMNHNFSGKDMAKFIKTGVWLDLSINDVNTPFYIYWRHLYKSLKQFAAMRGESVYKYLSELPCVTSLSDCEFNGQNFDCCQNAQFMTDLRGSCLEVNMNAIAQKSNQAINLDPLHLKNRGLVFIANTEWAEDSFQHGAASDGFHVLIDEVPNVVDVPVPIPAGMDATIILGPAKMIREKTQCIAEEAIPKLKYFGHYDPNGINCMWEMFLEVVGKKFLNCHPPAASYFSVNESCDTEQMTLLSLLVSDEFVGAGYISKHQIDEVIKLCASISSKDSPCKPLCSRWSYPVLSASYGAIQYGDKVEQTRQFANRSWSRIRIILPENVFLHMEESRASLYLMICDIGGMMGVYIGISMITFVQILAYGGYILWSKKKKMNTVGVQSDRNDDSSKNVGVSETSV